MSQRFSEFLIDRTGNAPRNLSESIRRVKNCSSGFRLSWREGHRNEAYETSQEAFEHFDCIQNELLRRRDANSGQFDWSASFFKAALDAAAGQIIFNVSEAEKSWFASLPAGSGVLPANSGAVELSLVTALNKLKHRSTSFFNCSLTENGAHLVHVYATAGMGQPSSISQIDVDQFCEACRVAASHTWCIMIREC